MSPTRRRPSIRSRPRSARNWRIRKSKGCHTRRRRTIATRCRCSMAWYRTALGGFNISDPVTGRLEARLNIDTIQSMDLENSRYAADNGRGSTGVLDLKTKMGDDRWRFGGTNFIPGVTSDNGLYINKWTPRLEFSGPIVKGRAWFHNGLDAFYNVDSVHGLPRGANRTSGLTASDLSRFQVNLTPANILTASFLYNLDRKSTRLNSSHANISYA